MRAVTAGNAVEIPEGILALVATMDGGLANGGSLRKPRFWSYGIALSTIAVFTWLMLAPIDRVIRSEGKVVPSGRNRVVQHLEGGVVSKIHVKEGDQVGLGQVLVDISAVEADSEIQERAIKLAGHRAKAARLLAEAEGVEMAEQTPQGADEGAWQLERMTLMGRRSKQRQTQVGYVEQLNQRQAEIQELTSRGKNLREELATARRQLETHEMLQQKRAASELDVLDARSKVQRLVTQLSEVDQRVPQLHAAIREIQSKLQTELATTRAEARAELALISTEARTIEEEIRHRGERLKRTVIVSPVAGAINRLFVTSEGTVVKPGEPVAEVTPSSSDLLIEVQVQPSDRAELRAGLPAVVKFGPYDYTLFGTLEAKVDDISADALTDERGKTYFRVRLKAAADDLKKFGQPVVPGMPLTADVVLSKRTVGSYIGSSVLRFSSAAMRDAR